MCALFNPRDSLEKRRELRHNATPMERDLWELLKGNQRLGFKFRRQFGVGPYILDFYCTKMHLCIEVDGESHQPEDARQYDQRRDQYLRDLGIHTLRFWNDQVRNNLDEVVKKIDSFLIAHSENSSETRQNP